MGRILERVPVLGVQLRAARVRLAYRASQEARRPEFTGGIMDHIRVKRIAVRLRDNDLATDRLRGIGYRAVSSSGWEGPTRKVRQDAVADMYARKAGTS